MAASATQRRSQSNRFCGSQSSQSSTLQRQTSSPWHTRDSSPDDINTQDVLDRLEETLRNAHRGSGRVASGGDGRRGRDDNEDIDTDHVSAEPPMKRSKSLASPTRPGRGIRKIVDLYHDLTVLLSKAKKQSTINALDPESVEEMERSDFAGMTEDEIDEERKDRKRCHYALKLLNTLIPGFEQKAARVDNITYYCSPLQSGANDARSDDTSRLKIAVAEWLNNRTTGPFTPTHLSAKGKDERGFNNDLTGYLLCPIDYDWNDPYTREKLRNGEDGYDFTSNVFLRCLYENESGDPDDPFIGFLKGPLLLRAYRHIFTAPSSASREESHENTSRRRDVATSLGINGRVTHRSIAYAATQLIFSLNSARDWKHEHAGFHYPAFYNFIVDFFEDLDHPGNENVTSVKKSLLQWWNMYV